jgi:peptide/nickel transport system ATP-binding protein
MTEVLAVDRITVDYQLPRQGLFAPARSLRAVDSISFSITRGRALGLVGESGCGKSSVARAVMGLERPSGGNIAILGRDIFAMAPRDLLGFRRHFQMIFQDPMARSIPATPSGES